MPTSVTIGYDAPWRQIHSLLLLAAERTAGHSPGSGAHRRTGRTRGLLRQVHAVRVSRRSATASPERWPTLHANIQDVFNEYGVQIMSPHYWTDPQSPKVVPKEHWAPPPARGTAPARERAALHHELLISEIRHSPLLWLLALRAGRVRGRAPSTRSPHASCSCCRCLPSYRLPTLLSHATESVAAKTGDSVGGLLNATLGNLTELVIALAALRAGEYALVTSVASPARSSPTRCSCLVRRCCSVGSSITCRSSTGSTPGFRPGCSSWPRWRCWCPR